MKRLIAAALVLVCLLTAVACSGDTTMTDLEAIRAKLTEKGYTAKIFEGSEPTIESELIAEDKNANSVTIFVFKTEEGAKFYHQVMQQQVNAAIEKNKAEEQYYSYLLEWHRDELSKSDAIQIETNVVYFRECIVANEAIVCARHGKAVVIASSKVPYDICK